MKKKIKSAVISIAVIAVLLLAILIGVKNGTLDKLDVYKRQGQHFWLFRYLYYSICSSH